MNIIPPASYNRTLAPKPRLARTNNTINHTNKKVQAERRTHSERRRKPINYHHPMDMRLAGDRRKTNRLFVTT